MPLVALFAAVFAVFVLVGFSVPFFVCLFVCLRKKKCRFVCFVLHVHDWSDISRRC